MWETVENLMEMKGVKASDVSKATGIPSSVFTDWKKGRYTPKADKLYTLAKFFEVPMEVFFDPDAGRRVSPVYSVAAGDGAYNEKYADEYMGVTEDEDGDYSWCRIEGNSMYPNLMDGDLIKVHHQTETSPNDYTVVKVDGEHVTCKFVEIADNGVWFRAINKEVYEDKFYSIQDVLTLPVTIVGKVVEIRRSLP